MVIIIRKNINLVAGTQALWYCSKRRVPTSLCAVCQGHFTAHRHACTLYTVCGI